jgi:DNA-binding NarL/FixJ family response regulator
MWTWLKPSRLWRPAGRSSVRAFWRRTPRPIRGLSAFLRAKKQILELVAQGKTDKVIASLLNLSENTVSVHRANIMEELGIHRATELILWAAKNGLVHLP